MNNIFKHEYSKLKLLSFRIPNELLKHSSSRFKEYLLVFLNQVLEDGIVPEAMNTGKCMLVFKVHQPSMIK